MIQPNNKGRDIVFICIFFNHFFYRISSMKMFTLKGKVIMILLAALCLQAKPEHVDECFVGCQSCKMFYFFMYCTQCLPQRYLDPTSGLCLCLSGSYDNGTSCKSCPNYCLTCNQSSCTSCTQDKYYNNGSCICKNGNGIDATGNCIITPTTDVGTILGIALGSTAGVICIVSLIIMMRRRSLGPFETDENIPDQLPSPNAIIMQIRPYTQDSSAYGTIQEPKLLKKFQFKPETCSICLDDSPLCMTECGHFFHEHCIGEWMRKRHNCPNCNHSISPMKLMKWCSTCKTHIIQPQISQFYRISQSRNPTTHREEIPIFWPTCANCQGFDEHIDLKGVK